MPGSMPASKMPRRKRTPQMAARSLTKAVQMETMPKRRVVMGRNQPGPIALQAIVAGISKRM